MRPNAKQSERRHLCTMTELRLTCSTFYVDVRLLEIDRRCIASADSPDGPSLGLGERAIYAIEGALEPFEGIVGRAAADGARRGA